MKQLISNLVVLLIFFTITAHSQTPSQNIQPWRVDGRMGYSMLQYNKSSPEFNSRARSLNIGLQFRIKRIVLAVDMNFGEHTTIVYNGGNITGDEMLETYKFGVGYAVQSKHLELVPKLLYLDGYTDLWFENNGDIDDLRIRGAVIAVDINFTPRKGYGFYINIASEIDPIFGNAVPDTWDNVYRQLSVGVRMDLFNSQPGE
ncbi:hypothetical protein [Phaeocystidibacter luteus]|uniref:Outer membrane beta-barrel protein n=1 Tax=Phaeocystidibacter luteus TaxID=911197 RepID=A0A6N6RLM8_9FLAO|nr:hypothetical protein [Phaeocystidibacter luteus]KAB2814472.1 hypothetical protein F8C67_01680 [Phaeocystidibacter luteus]